MEQDVQLFERATFALGKSEEAPDKASQAKTTKEKGRLTSPVGFVSVEHVRHGDSEDDGSGSLDCGGNGDGLLAETRGRDLGDDDEADWSNRHLVYKGPNIHQRGGSPDGSSAGWDAEKADDEQEGGHHHHASVINRPSSEFELRSYQRMHHVIISTVKGVRT